MCFRFSRKSRDVTLLDAIISIPIPKPKPILPLVEMGEQDRIAVTVIVAVLIVSVLIISVLLLQAVADEVVPLRSVGCFG